MKKLVITIFALGLILMAGAAHAAMVTETFTGTIDLAVDGNVFGVAEDDVFTWSASYDLDYKNTLGNIVVENDMALSVTIGSRTFVETEDVFYGMGMCGGPILGFDADDNVALISFLIDDLTNNYRFSAYLDGFTIHSIGTDGLNDELLVSGTFDMSPVPVPGAAWLLGSGLLGIVGLRRRSA
jgi:hypothetical protein